MSQLYAANTYIALKSGSVNVNDVPLLSVYTISALALMTEPWDEIMTDVHNNGKTGYKMYLRNLYKIFCYKNLFCLIIPTFPFSFPPMSNTGTSKTLEFLSEKIIKIIFPYQPHGMSLSSSSSSL